MGWVAPVGRQTARGGLMHEGFGRGGHNGEVCFPLQNLSRFSQTVGGEVLLDELEELLLGEADLGLGDDGRPVQSLQGEVPLGGAVQATGTV